VPLDRAVKSAVTEPYALLLAAGSGSRFGGDKLLATFHGKPLAAHPAVTLAQAISTGILAGGVAVVPSGDTRLTWLFDTAGLRVIDNPEAAPGMASSLRHGLAALARPENQPRAGAALIVLADQPMLSGAVIAGLVQFWRREGRSVRPRYAREPQAPGHPVLLDRSLWPLADRLTGDQGFGPELREVPNAMTVIDMPGANPDVDTPDDLRQLEDPVG
jgi:CTP:molybdopterin cytidylyltransferase MocA